MAHHQRWASEADNSYQRHLPESSGHQEALYRTCTEYLIAGIVELHNLSPRGASIFAKLLAKGWPLKKALHQTLMTAGTQYLSERQQEARYTLTPREWDVAVFLPSGLKNSAIASHLDITESMVSKHITRACRKLGIHGRAALAGWAQAFQVSAPIKPSST